MARIRTIKPTFFTSLTVGNLTPEERLTFIGIWTYVDDQGAAVDDARLVKAAVWPLDDRTAADVSDDMDAIVREGRLCRYTVGGKRFFHVIDWEEHQRISHPGTPTTPPCPIDHSADTNPQVTGPSTDPPESFRNPPEDFRSPPESFRPEGKGREGKGREQGEDCGAAPRALAVVGNEPDPTPAFDDFWNQYPLKTGKSAARKAWAKLDIDDALRVIDDLDVRWVGYWATPGADYTPHASSWLNARRFDDDGLPPIRRQARSNGDSSLDAIMATDPGRAGRAITVRGVGA